MTVSILWRIRDCGYCMSFACFAHFTWQRLQPLPVRKLYDTVRLTASCLSLQYDAELSLAKEEQPDSSILHSNPSSALDAIMYVRSNSRTAAVFSVSQLALFSSSHRYLILEDIGLAVSLRNDWPGFVATQLPLLLSCTAVGIFNGTLLVFIHLVGFLSYPVRTTVLALVSYWQMKREDTDSDILKPHSSVRTRKLLVMAVINTGLAVYGLYWQTTYILNTEWATPLPLTENIASLQTVLAFARSDLDTYDISGTTRAAISMPLLAFYVFAWFGLGEEARRAYGEALLKLGHLIGVTHREHWSHPSTLPFSWPTIVLRKAKLQQWLADALSLVQRNVPQITPYISSVPPDDEPQVPASPTRIQPSNSVGNRIDNKRQGRVPTREPARRLSIHKPPLAALNPANTIPSILEIPLRRLSHHKPPFVPLIPPNAPATATLVASRGTPPRKGAADEIRQQGESTPRPHSRRLSYHKRSFVPLAPASAKSAVPDAWGPTIPLVEIPRGTIGERDAVSKAENVVEGILAPPPLASPSTSMVPPPLSTLSTTTPAPQYQEVDPFLERSL
jgi:Pheromone A receptor